MIDHVSIGVRDLGAAAVFYEAVLATIGLEKLVVRAATVGFGKTYPEFWLNAQRAVDLWKAQKERKREIERIKPLNAA